VLFRSLRAVLDGLRHGHGHAAVLERPGRVHALELHEHLRAGSGRKSRCRDERSAALPQGDDGRGIRHIEAIGVFAEDSAPLVGHYKPSTRKTEVIELTTSLRSRPSTVAARSASDAS